jgi:hypothetical protein
MRGLETGLDRNICVSSAIATCSAVRIAHAKLHALLKIAAGSPPAKSGTGTGTRTFVGAPPLEALWTTSGVAFPDGREMFAGTVEAAVSATW